MRSLRGLWGSAAATRQEERVAFAVAVVAVRTVSAAGAEAAGVVAPRCLGHWDSSYVYGSKSLGGKIEGSDSMANGDYISRYVPTPLRRLW